MCYFLGSVWCRLSSLLFLVGLMKCWCYLLTIFLQEEKINDDVEFLVLASDGLWDVVSNQV